MDVTEKWNKIVDFYLKNRNALETQVQKDWETICSEILGYKVTDGNSEPQKHIAFATGNPIIIDILLRKDNEDICVVELKQHQPLEKKWEEQLFTYLKQTKIRVGVLVCDKIHLYSYDFHKDDSQQSCMTIDFEKDNPDGIQFVELFSFPQCNKEHIAAFIDEQGGRRQNVKAIQEQINQDLLYSLLKEHFAQKYSVEDFNAAVQNMDLIISMKHPAAPTPTYTPAPKGKDKNDLEKHEIQAICRNNGINLPGEFTKAKLNVGPAKYWANPNKRFLSQEWWLVLVDLRERKLHVFKIPANSIRADELKYKDANLIDLQIHYNDHRHPNFTDSRSDLEFKRWLVRTIPY